jgi:hypothetical protein
MAAAKKNDKTNFKSLTPVLLCKSFPFNLFQPAPVAAAG